MSHAAGPSGGKVAGFLLLGVAAIALVIGLVTVISGGDESRADGNAAASSSAAAPPTTSGGATTSAAPSSPGNGGGNGGNTGGNGGNGGGSGGNGGNGGGAPGGNTTTVLPPPPAGGGGGSTGGSADTGGARPVVDRGSPVRVYNNSTIKGLARKAAADFRSAGFNVVRVDNYSQGVIPATTVYWGTSAEKGTATSLAHRFGLRVEKRFRGIQHASPGVIVIVTNNYPG